MGKVIPQFKSVSDNLEKAIDAIRSSTVGRDSQYKIGDLIDNITKAIQSKDPAQIAAAEQKFADCMNNMPKDGATKQICANNAQQISALFTGESKQVTTKLAAISQLDTEVTKLGSSVASSKEAYQTMINAIINASRAA